MIAADILVITNFLAPFLKITSNRDKALKVIQYTLKLVILRRKRSKNIEGLKAFQNIASALSLARLIYRLGDWIHPIYDELPAIIKGNIDYTSIGFLESSMSFVNAILDDLITIDKCSKGEFPAFSEHTTAFLELWSTKLWLGTTLINLYLQLKKISLTGNYDRKVQLLTVSKLACDVIFCLYDINDFPRYKELPIIAGLLAATIGIYKEILKHIETK